MNHKFGAWNVVLGACLVLGMWCLVLAPIEAAEQPVASSPKATYDAQGKRDPFVPLVKDGKLIGGKTEGSLPELGGILWDPENPIAMIGDRELTVGDAFDDYKVVEIRESSVILEDSEGARFEIKQTAF